MIVMTESNELGVTQVAERIHGRLQRYLEAQYHIRDTGIIEERRLLLGEPGSIAQRPFIEVTPSYAVAGTFSQLNIPVVIRDLLQYLSELSPSIGVFPPYKHQADALENFFADGHDGSDLIVATGTGSGKTETFLYTILGLLALEGAERQKSFARHGVRALLLYPMNALVSDQTARLRRMFGDERLAGLFRGRWGRHPRFGMYTSRTPYPGVRKGDKDQRHIAPLLEYYVRLATSESEEDERLVAELKKRGRWPAKDLVAFFAEGLEEEKVYKTGKKAGQKYTAHHWSERFVTHPEDRELLTRHEIQERAPDLLVTNYSMLEYMLLRPIERSIFNQTRAWLAADARNQFLIILDEAHMYRGVGGAEVGLLIRRLMSRLGVSRDRLRCILTSASLGSGEASARAAQEFARGLTGQPRGRSFAVVRGTPEARTGDRPGTPQEAKALSEIDGAVLAAAEVDSGPAHDAIVSVAKNLGWEEPPPASTDLLPLRQYVTRQLTGLGPLELLIRQCSGNATAFAELAQILFPGRQQAEAERATDGLLALGCLARRTESGREEQPLLPTRVHMMFRGLPPVYACLNRGCEERRFSPGEELLVGRLSTEPSTRCECGARVFELYTHRDCGAAYMRVFGSGPDADFYWHERGGTLTEFGGPLHELHLLLDEPHPRMQGDVLPVWVDISTGRVLRKQPPDSTTARLCFLPSEPSGAEENLTTFPSCPVCRRRTKTGRTRKIMDLSTKGEQPFANLVREQFVSQVETRRPDGRHPNGGRKALLFSDGRQKAARLARDLPREVERDSFREALALAAYELAKVKDEVVLDESLYGAFVAVCAKHHLHFFDGSDQRQLLEECNRFLKHYDGELEFAFDSDWKPVPPTRYRQALLRQLSDPYYSLVAACAAVVSPRPKKFRLFERQVNEVASPETLAAIASAWIREMLSKSAFDPALSKDAREDEFAYFEPVRSDEGLKKFFDEVMSRGGLDSDTVLRVRDALFDVFTREGQGGSDSGRLLSPDSLVLELALEDSWLQCAACGHLQLRPFMGACANIDCGERTLEERSPEHPYMVSRKGFFREPLRAVIAGARPIHITAEEHTAQLSQRDAGVVYATTEEFELRFQDVPLGPKKPPVDVLSCTTTMEVGIDIGSLTAVGLRTVPPQRENYQQRAGRAGRRGTSVSSVITFAQGGAHDAHYFTHPQAMISGAPREPRIKSDNRRLARRHVHSHLLQTFFHGELDKLSEEEERQLAASRPGIMSAFGTASDFFGDSGPITFSAFERWINQKVLSPKSKVVDEVASWLPDEIARDDDPLENKRAFVREVAEQFLSSMDELRSELGLNLSPGGESEEQDEDDNGSLIDLLFDKGMLPSYAFPTDLCSFVIQEPGEKGRVNVKERPQLSKSQALSEYAPGRLLVVNKRTYRVGGVYVEGLPTSSPAVELFSSDLTRYVGCRHCTFVRLEPGNATHASGEGDPCPVCGAELYVRELLDPPAFTPEGGAPLREGDREQDITYASSAQLPELVEREDFAWRDGAGENLQHAHGEDVLLVVANKGREGEGFSICELCGAAWADVGEVPSGAHKRPFLLPKYVWAKEHASPRCNGNVRPALFLGHQFRTDILLLRVLFKDPLDFSPKQPWLYDALSTLAEAVSLGASLHLDIDPGELSAGFRLSPPLGDERGLAELFLYDTASGGAGYAYDAGEELAAVLDCAEELLRDCPAGCERSCTNCLRHYGNRFLHPRLDRRLGLQLLRYIRFGEVPAVAPPDQQAQTLAPLGRFLELEGWTVLTGSKHGSVTVPLLATSPSGKAIAIGTHPSLVSSEHAGQVHDLRKHKLHPTLVLQDYVVERDLPAAYQFITEMAPRSIKPGGNTNPEHGVVEVSLPVYGIDDLAAGRGRVLEHLGREVENPSADCFAVRVPLAALTRLGIARDAILVLRPPRPDDYDGGARLLISRREGHFKLTGTAWTVAQVKRLSDEDGERRQISYARTEADFRPERLRSDDLRVIGAVIDVVQD
jgi:ATP-dependent helicase YprA (DUF1998 family)